MKQRIIVAGLVAVASAVALATPAGATNLGTKSGVRTSACQVVWDASSTLNTALQNDDPTYPNLMTDLDGQPAPGGGNAYTNGGYITEVRPEYGGTGILEVNHFYLSDTAGVWRIPTATDVTIADAKVVVTLPAGSQDVTFDGVSTNASMTKWGGVYARYTWAQQATSATPLGGNSYEIDLGTLAAGTGTVYQLNFTWPTGTNLAQNYVASAELTGSYAAGTGSCPAPTPEPSPSPTQPSATAPAEDATASAADATASAADASAPPAPATPTASATPTTPATTAVPAAPATTGSSATAAAKPGLAHAGGQGA